MCVRIGGSGASGITFTFTLYLNREGRWGTTDNFADSFLHFSLLFTALWDLTNSRPVHSLMLSSHLFFCLFCLLPPSTVPCKMVLARPDEWGTCPYHCMQFASLFGGQEVFTWSDCQLELGTDRVVSDLVFVKILSYKGEIRSRKDRRQKSFLIAVFLFLASCTNAERLTFTRSGLFLKLKRISLELWLQIAL